MSFQEMVAEIPKLTFAELMILLASNSRFVYKCSVCGNGVRRLLIDDEPGEHRYIFKCSVCAIEYPPAWREAHHGEQEQPPKLKLERWKPTAHKAGDFSDNQAKWMVISKAFEDGAWKTALSSANELQQHILRTGEAKSIRCLLPLIGELQMKAYRLLFQELNDANRSIDRLKALLQNAKIREAALREEITESFRTEMPLREKQGDSAKRLRGLLKPDVNLPLDWDWKKAKEEYLTGKHCDEGSV